MNSKTKEPDKSVGGTFFYDKEGNFERHEPTTKTRAPVHERQAQAAEAEAKTKRSK